MTTSKFEDFKQAVWDPQTKTFLGRTGSSWAKIIGFFIALYTCLVTIWMLYFQIFHLTISEKYPKWQLNDSLIGTVPGLGLRPQNPRHRVESALIRFNMSNQEDLHHWVDDIDEYLKSLVHPQEGVTTSHNCNAKNPTDTESFCPFDGSSIPPECTSAQNYSFSVGKPCVLIKLNRIYGWLPQTYDSKPPKYPEEAPFTPNAIQITCEGQHDSDKEHIGPVAYYPNNGIETKHYPYTNQPGYQSPYVMVHFKNPKLNTLIFIECKAWAKNIDHDRYNRKGMNVFELFIEKSPDSDSGSSSSE